MRILTRLAALCVYAVFLFAVFPAIASDGVVEISSERALIGGITPGDSPGYPVTISEPGSYRLTNTLFMITRQQGIYVDADNVTIDLNGFGIRGPVTCTPSVSGCDQDIKNGTEGIKSSSDANFLTIKNGTITGTGDRGIYCVGLGCVVENVVVSHSNRQGMYLGTYARVRNCTIHTNRSSGVRVGTGSIVINNTIYENGYSGLETSGSGGAIVTSNVFSKNGTTEINMEGKITAIGGNTLDPIVEGNWFDSYSGVMVEIGNNFCIDSSSPPHTNCTGL